MLSAGGGSGSRTKVVIVGSLVQIRIVLGKSNFQITSHLYLERRKKKESFSYFGLTNGRGMYMIYYIIPPLISHQEPHYWTVHLQEINASVHLLDQHLPVSN
ncbi:hypothetical protein KSP39_PZI012380 [Platanthera zijinensis]|uniref:Uncharacterized protein n=1 Tax=Platanthera zijinensis TaxID=2320716 RepID=A0AAP0BFJ2_9ASPA